MKNYLGVEISGRKQFADPSFGYYDENGKEIVYWKPEDDYVDSDGLRVQCTVIKGRVAPMFNSNGGAVQYKHYQSIAKELEDDVLDEVFL